MKMKKWPFLSMLAAIVSGAIIAGLGVYLVSHQESARLLELNREVTGRLGLLRNQLEKNTGQAIEKVFRQLEDTKPGFDNPQELQQKIKDVLLSQHIVKYPFFIDSTRNYLFPISRKARFPKMFSTLDLEKKMIHKGLRELYLQGYRYEYEQKKFILAIKSYMKCLEQNPGDEIKIFIYDALGRSYYKMNGFREALYFYTQALELYRQKTLNDPLFYFSILRQIAVSYKQLGSREEANNWYLKLYEEMTGGDITYSEGPFAFYKNEVLDYLNRNFQLKEDNPDIMSRFIKAKTQDRLGEASPLEISLMWSYFDTGFEVPGNRISTEVTIGDGLETSVKNLSLGITEKEGLRFYKLREFYESGDDKVRFYQAVKKLDAWRADSHEPDNHSRYFETLQIQNPVTNTLQSICYRKMHSNQEEKPASPSDKTVYFGFLLDTVQTVKEVLRELAVRYYPEKELLVEVQNQNQTADNKSGEGLMSIPMGLYFPGHNLVLQSRQENYFQVKVQREILLYYFLLGALILTLALGIFLFYKYISREAQLLRIKSEFVDSASHTLKTPLTRISLLAENVAQGWVTDENMKEAFFQTIISETTRMSEMIDNMLNFSRIEAGKQSYNPEELFLQEVISDVTGRYAKYLDSLGFQLKVDIREKVSPVLFDRKAAGLILGNLLHNAVKYSIQEKQILIKLYTQNYHIILEVSDKGIGILKEHLPLLFKKFSRIPDDRVKSIEGSGLGLFLTHHAVHAHHGDIQVISEPGKGTCFKISFPSQP